MKYTITTIKQIGSKKEMEHKSTNMFNNGTHFENLRMVEIKRIFKPIIKFEEVKWVPIMPSSSIETTLGSITV